MNDSSGLVLHVQIGMRLRRVPVSVLAEALDVKRARLEALVRSLAEGRGQSVDKLWTETQRFRETFHKQYRECNETFQGGGVEGEISDDELTQRLGQRLGDDRNLGWLRRLVHGYSRDLILEALRRTMAVPPENIRKSRGAYFTGILRILARESARGPEPETDTSPHDSTTN